MAMGGALYYLSEAFSLLQSNLNRVLAIAVLIALEFGVLKTFNAKAGEGTREKMLSTGAIILCNIVIGAFAAFFAINLIRDLGGGHSGDLCLADFEMRRPSRSGGR